MKYTLIGLVKPESEDGGCAQIATISDDNGDGLFVRIQSWNEENPPYHPAMDSLKNKYVRVTIEVIGENIPLKKKRKK